MEDLGSVCPFVQILDLLVPQTVGYVEDALRILDRPMAEQVIEVPKISSHRVLLVLEFLSRRRWNSWWKCRPCCLLRASLCRSPSRSSTLQFRRVGVASGVFMVFSQNRVSSTAQTAEQLVDIPFSGGGLSGSFPGQSTTARTIEQIVDIPSGGGLGQGSPSSAGRADEDFTGVVRTFSPWKNVRSAGQVVSAQLGEHVSSSTLSAHQMARAGEPVDSDGSIEWVKLHVGETDQTNYWNRRSGATTWRAPAGVKVVWTGGRTVTLPSVFPMPALAVEYTALAPTVISSPAPILEYLAPAPAAVPVESSMPCVEQDISVEEEEYNYRGVVCYSGSCKFLDMVDYKWRSQGEGTFRLLRHSTGAKIFQLWQRRQLLTDDYISGLVLRPGQSGRSWRWRDPEFGDGPSDCRHAMRFGSPELARRVYEEWNSSS